jgi:hypothetical protein
MSISGSAAVAMLLHFPLKIVVCHRLGVFRQNVCRAVVV